jgi:ankyrin repeat protein
LGKLVKIFLEHGGNPNTANGREETSLHSICHNPDNPHLRLVVMNDLLKWRSLEGEDGCQPESVSINHVDGDGNAAVHYASSNGLLECVERLISLGAIISIVNKAQKTCCELADAEEHRQLASMLELALVFQPADQSMEAFDESEEQYFLSRNTIPLLGLDCQVRVLGSGIRVSGRVMGRLRVRV